MRCYVCESAGSIAADSVAVNCVQTDFDLLIEEGEPGVAPDTPASNGVVRSAKSGVRELNRRVDGARGGGRRSDARKGASSEIAEDAEHLVVTPAGFQSSLDDEIGGLIV